MKSMFAVTAVVIAAAALAVGGAACSKNAPKPANPQTASAKAPAADPAPAQGAQQAQAGSPAAEGQGADTAAQPGAAQGGKCAQAVDHMFDLAKAMVLKSVSKDKAAQVEQQMKQKMAAQRPTAISRCQAQLKKHPQKTEKQLDCMIAAKAITDAQQCASK